jgi:hypothetical protein
VGLNDVRIPLNTIMPVRITTAGTDGCEGQLIPVAGEPEGHTYAIA